MKRKIFATVFSAIMIIGIFNINSISSQRINTDDDFIISTSGDLSNNHAVIVGISDYQGDANDLPSPALQAENMAELLSEQGWDSENIRLLTNKQAKRENILENLSWLSEQQGTVLFYFSGHGSRVKDIDGDEEDLLFPKDEAIVPWEATEKTFILDDELKVILDGFNADETVCIFVSCFSGGLIEEEETSIVKTMFRKITDFFPRIAKLFSKPYVKNLITTTSGRNEEDFIMVPPMEELQGNNRIIMTACQEDRVTYEFVVAGQPFAVILGQALYGGLIGESAVDKNKDGYVSAEEAFKYAQPRASLEAAILMGAPIAIISAIDGWMQGELTLIEVLFVCTIYGFMLPVPQIYDSNPSQDIILTKI